MYEKSLRQSVGTDFTQSHSPMCAFPKTSLLGLLHDGWAVAMESLPYERLGNARYARSTRIVGLLERYIYPMPTQTLTLSACLPNASRLAGWRN